MLALGRASVPIGVDGAEAEVPNGRFLDSGVIVYERERDTPAATTD